MKSWILFLFLCSIFLVPAQDAFSATGHFTTENNLAIPMRDGVVLRADILRPAAIGRKFPVLVYRTPYGKDAAQREY
ncbi:MAG TPA: CocE/NonD family hydrolase, partial [Candidatus Acidoferrum sp.]